MHSVGRDLRHSFRSLVRLPALSATIVLTVGIGLGSTTAMIGLIRSVLTNPLPYADPGELFWIYTDNPPYRFRLSVVDYRALEADHPTFSAVAAYQTVEVTVTDRDLAERVTSKAVTGSYFPLLHQRPHLGRLFDAADDVGSDRVVVLTYAFWARRFGRDPFVLGRTISIDGASSTIVGVLERTTGPLEHDVALFTVARWPTPTRRGPFFTMVLARLRSDVSPAVARDALRATNTRLFPIWRSSYQDANTTWGMMDLRERAVGDIGSTLGVMLAAVGSVLLIACANAVNLLISRSLHRRRELAIRGALGASPRRLVQHVAVEAALLTAGASLLGLAVAVILLQLVRAYGEGYIPRIEEIGLSGAALLALAGLALASGIGIALVPAWHGSRLPVDQTLRAGTRSVTDGPGARRLRRALVAVEFALATPLLVAASLVLATLDQLTRVPVGIDTSRVLTAAVALPGARYPRGADREAFWKRALERLASLPGVQSVALADSRPPHESGNRNNFNLEDRPTPEGQNQPICTWIGVSPAFFSTVGLPLERGRLLDDRSFQDNVVVVDRSWANRFFPGEEVLGRRFREGGCTACPWTTVVGVVGNVKWTGLDAPEDGTVYFPFVDSRDAFFVLRTAAEPSSLAQSLRQAVRELDPGLALTSVATGDDLVSEALTTPRYLTVLIGMFALAALVLAAVGVYGVMAHFVQQDARDIGIRLALGGDPTRVRRTVVLQGLGLVGVGVAVGAGAALVTSRLMTAMLFGVSPTDPGTILTVCAVLVTIATLACLVPARRAARIDPAVILKDA